MPHRLTGTQFVANQALARSIYRGGASSGEVVGKATFDFSTPSPLVLQALSSGLIVNRAALVIETPFDSSAGLELGTSSNPGALLSASDFTPSVAGQYESSVLLPIFASDFLILTINPGVSTQGSGFLLYKIR